MFTFLSISGEPQRFRAFVHDLSVFQSLFVFGFRHLHHIMSQTAILSIADLSQMDDSVLFFVGKVEHYDEHWDKLAEMCVNVDKQTKELRLMPSYGARLYVVIECN